MRKKSVGKWQSMLLLSLIGGVTLGMTQPLTVNPADGRQYFAANCAACHSTSRGTNGIGPSLAGIIGRRSGSVPGFSYSPGLKSANIIWTRESLDRWLQRPTNGVHTTRMMISVPSQSDRQTLITYLQTL